jgi:predicted ATPase
MAVDTDLLEREPQLAALATLLDSARRGEGRVALVHGEAGIGKTALVDRFARRHAAGGARLLWGGCDPLSTPLPLAPVLDVAWLHGGTLAERVAQGASRDDIFQAYIAALRDPRSPTIAVIEDVHWADEATLDLIRFVGRRAERLRALLIVTWRDDEAGHDQLMRSVIGELPRGVGQRIALCGLSPAAVDALAARARRSAAGLHAASNGNHAWRGCRARRSSCASSRRFRHRGSSSRSSARPAARTSPHSTSCSAPAC